MGRKVTGYTEWRGGRWKVQATDPHGSRDWYDLPATIRQDQPEVAAAVGTRVAQKIRAGEYVASERDETVADFGTRWCDWRERRGLASAIEDRSTMKNHLGAELSTMPIRAVRREDLEDLVARLDRRVAAGEIKWKTAENVWLTVRKMFSDATKAKDRALRVLNANPAADVVGPDRGEDTAKQFLYPSEFLKLMECEDVPLLRRRLYACAVYTFSRAGELAAWSWATTDLEHDVVLFHSSIDRCRTPDKVTTTKGNDARRVPIEPNLKPLLEAMFVEASSARVFRVLPRVDGGTGLAALFRRDLRAAGVDRAELHVPAPSVKPITFHDLRATGCTWAAVRGDDPLKIKQRAGHKSFQTTERYIREAEALRAGFGEPFPSLPACIMESSKRPGANRPRIAQSPKVHPKTPGNPVGAAGIEQPAKRHETPVFRRERSRGSGRAGRRSQRFATTRSGRCAPRRHPRGSRRGTVRAGARVARRARQDTRARAGRGPARSRTRTIPSGRGEVRVHVEAHVRGGAQAVGEVVR